MVADQGSREALNSAGTQGTYYVTIAMGVVGVALKFILVCQHGSLEPTVPVEGLDWREKSRLKGFLMHARRYSKWTRPST